MPRRSLSIRWWLASLVLGVALPLTLLLMFLLMDQVRTERLEARYQALGVAKAVADRLRILEIDSAALLERMSTRPDVQAFDSARCDSLFSLVEVTPEFLDLVLVDQRGTIVCSGTPRPANASLARAARETLVRDLLNRKLPTTPPIHHTISNQWISIDARPVTGSFRGTLALFTLPEVAAREMLLPGSIMTVFEPDGTIIARTDDAAHWVGRNVRTFALTDVVLRQREGVTQTKGLDGMYRQGGFTSIPRLGISIYVGVPTAVVAESMNEALERGVIGGVVIILLIVASLIMSRTIGRSIDTLSLAAASIAKGAFKPVHLTGPREMVALAETFNDMVESRSRAERQMRESEQTMKALSDRLLVAQEQERTRIAREIHDDLGQVLTALKMDVIGLMNRMENGDSPMRERVLHTLDAMVTSVQRISSELRPSVLDDLGLIPAIDSEARAFEERTGIECDVSIPEDLQVDTSRATAIFRIIQEALTNVARHSNAARVELRLRPRETELLIEVRDDGRGITSQEVGSTRSFGLIGIRERAAVVGGSVRFEGVPGRGTIVSVRIPLTMEATPT